MAPNDPNDALAIAKMLRAGYKESGTFCDDSSTPRRPQRQAPRNRHSSANPRGGGRGGPAVRTHGSRPLIAQFAGHGQPHHRAAAPPNLGPNRRPSHLVNALGQTLHGDSQARAEADTAGLPARVISFYQADTGDNANVASIGAPSMSATSGTSTSRGASGNGASNATITPFTASGAGASLAPVATTTPAQSTLAMDWNMAIPTVDGHGFGSSDLSSAPVHTVNGDQATTRAGTNGHLGSTSVPTANNDQASATTATGGHLGNKVNAASTNVPPGHVINWHYQDRNAQPGLVPVTPVEPQSSDMMDVDSPVDGTSSMSSSTTLVEKQPYHAPHGCTCFPRSHTTTAKGLNVSRWANTTGSPLASSGKFSYAGKAAVPGAPCPIHGNHHSQSGGGSKNTTGYPSVQYRQ